MLKNLKRTEDDQDSFDDIQIENLNKSTHEDDFLAGLNEVEVPEYEVPPEPNPFSNEVFDQPSALGSIQNDNVSESNPKDDPVISQNKINLDETLAGMVRDGLSSDIADMIKNFCKTGMESMAGLMVATLAMEGLNSNQVRQLCISSLAGKNIDNVTALGNQMLGRASGLDSQMGQGSSAGFSGGGGNGSNAASGKSTNSPGLLNAMGELGSAFFKKGAEAISHIPINFGPKNTSNQNNVSEQLSFDEHYSTVQGAITDMENRIRAVSQAADGSKDKEDAVDALVHAKTNFTNVAEKAVGGAKSPEEAESLISLIRGGKQKITKEFRAGLDEEEKNQLKDFFKMLDERLKLLLKAVTAGFVLSKAEQSIGAEKSAEATTSPSMQP